MLYARSRKSMITKASNGVLLAAEKPVWPNERNIMKCFQERSLSVGVCRGLSGVWQSFVDHSRLSFNPKQWLGQQEKRMKRIRKELKICRGWRDNKTARRRHTKSIKGSPKREFFSRIHILWHTLILQARQSLRKMMVRQHCLRREKDFHGTYIARLRELLADCVLFLSCILVYNTFYYFL